MTDVIGELIVDYTIMTREGYKTRLPPSLHDKYIKALTKLEKIKLDIYLQDNYNIYFFGKRDDEDRHPNTKGINND